MRTMNFGNETEYSFWGNVEYSSNEEAKKARDAKAKELKSLGYKINKWVLRNQMRQYSGFGQPDGRTGHAYKVTAQR